MADQKIITVVPQGPDGPLRSINLPLIEGTLGPAVLDVRRLYNDYGYFTFDPGYTSTGSCESKITFIDGEKGVLLYRGYPIEEIAQADHLEVAYLLLYGDLPNAAQFQAFVENIKHHTMVHEQVHHFFRGFRRDAHPMAVMVGVVGALSAFYSDSLEIHEPHERELAIYRLIGKVPTIASMAYRYSIGIPFAYPQNHLNYAENFLHLMFSLPVEPYKVSPALARAMNLILVLHADHEQNASTSTVRMAGSSGAHPFACVAAGIASLWGPAHGGANEAVLQMLLEMGDRKNIPHYIKRAKDKNDPFRLMGFGHRVYKNYDPRAHLLRESCYEVLKELGCENDPLFDLAMELERLALEDDYFIEKKLFPNVDFYSGIILKAMGIPLPMFTALFAVSRTVGWLAQWKEMIEDPDQKIGRPRQLYTGPPQRKFVPLHERS